MTSIDFDRFVEPAQQLHQEGLPQRAAALGALLKKKAAAGEPPAPIQAPAQAPTERCCRRRRNDPYTVVETLDTAAAVEVADANDWARNYRRCVPVLTVTLEAELETPEKVFKKKRVTRPIDAEGRLVKPCKYDQLLLPGWGGLEACCQGFRGILRANTFAGAKANARGTKDERGILYRPSWTAPNAPLRCYWREVRVGCVTAHYSAMMVAQLMSALTGCHVVGVEDRPSRAGRGNGMWAVFFASHVECENALAFTGCAVTGDEGTWLFDDASGDAVRGWCNSRCAGIDAVLQHPVCAYGNSPVSIERPNGCW